MTKHEAFATGKFERVEFTKTGTTANGTRRWAIGFITYKRHPYEIPITEGFMLELPKPEREASHA